MAKVIFRRIFHEPINPSEKLEFSEKKTPRSRALTFSEKKVNWDGIEGYLDKNETKLNQEIRELLKAEQAIFIKALNVAALAGDTDKIKSLTLKKRTEYKQIIKSYLKDSFEYGKNTASKEMDVAPPPTPNDIARNIDMAAEAMAEQHLARLEVDAKLQTADALVRGETVAVAVSAIDAKMIEAIGKIADQTSGIVVAGHFNKGRRVVFEANSDDVYALQRSERLDKRTCNYCLSMDARVIAKDDPFGRVDTFHTNCRGLWVDILNDEEGKPNIDGIPKTLRDRFGEGVNDLIQPRVPITKAVSNARNYVTRKRKR